MCKEKNENAMVWEDKMEKERKEEVKQKHRRDVEIKRSLLLRFLAGINFDSSAFTFALCLIIVLLTK